MSAEHWSQPPEPPRRPLGEFYRDVVVPAAKGLEAFGWRVAWFVLFLMFIWSLGRPR